MITAINVVLFALTIIAFWAAYFLLLEPFLRWLGQWDAVEALYNRYSIMVAVPLPSACGDWAVFAVFLGAFPIRVESPFHPHAVNKTNRQEALKLTKKQFNVLWD